MTMPRGVGERERVCRHTLRLPVAGDRVRVTDDGQVVLQLRHRWIDGTTQVVFDPVEFLGRLVVLVRRPRINLILYHGVLAPWAAWRSAVVLRQTSGNGRDAGVRESGSSTSLSGLKLRHRWRHVPCPSARRPGILVVRMRA
jgi:hypothetical protein